jgi:hypothetical protein
MQTYRRTLSGSTVHSGRARAPSSCWSPADRRVSPDARPLGREDARRARARRCQRGARGHQAAVQAAEMARRAKQAAVQAAAMARQGILPTRTRETRRRARPGRSPSGARGASPPEQADARGARGACPLEEEGTGEPVQGDAQGRGAAHWPGTPVGAGPAGSHRAATGSPRGLSPRERNAPARPSRPMPRGGVWPTRRARARAHARSDRPTRIPAALRTTPTALRNRLGAGWPRSRSEGTAVHSAAHGRDRRPAGARRRRRR